MPVPSLQPAPRPEAARPTAPPSLRPEAAPPAATAVADRTAPAGADIATAVADGTARTAGRWRRDRSPAATVNPLATAYLFDAAV
jgi:hypothetical protein